MGPRMAESYAPIRNAKVDFAKAAPLPVIHVMLHSVSTVVISVIAINVISHVVGTARRRDRFILIIVDVVRVVIMLVIQYIVKSVVLMDSVNVTFAKFSSAVNARNHGNTGRTRGESCSVKTSGVVAAKFAEIAMRGSVNAINANFQLVVNAWREEEGYTIV